MRTIALRFAENFSPEKGTIAAHMDVIEREGSVWYGKFGSPVSAATAKKIMESNDPQILLIHSGGNDRWWAHVNSIQRQRPDERGIPPYYERVGDKFSCWFHITRIERAPKNVMSYCTVASSGKKLSIASRYSMSPYFIIDYDESQGEDK